MPGSARVSRHRRRRKVTGERGQRRRVSAATTKSTHERYSVAREVRGRGLIQGLQLDVPARPIVEQALAEGVLFNSTQDTVLRFLPPFLLQQKHVDKGVASSRSC